jgi:type I site-specific restriction endonuclease
MLTAEQQARVVIDQLLTAAGWAVQDVKAANVHAARP